MAEMTEDGLSNPALAATYAALVESIDQGFTVIRMLFDAAGRPVDYEFLETNPAFEQQTGLKNVIGKTIRTIASQHEEHWYELYGNVVSTGQPVRVSMPARELDDRWFSVYAFRTGNPDENKVAVLLRDITAEKRAEENLQWSEATHKFLLFLGDRLNREESAEGVASVSVEALSHFLDLDRAGYFDMGDMGNDHSRRSLAVEWGGDCSRALGPEDIARPGPGVESALRSGQSWGVSNVETEANDIGGMAAQFLRGLGVASLLVQPVMRNRKLVGAFYCGNSIARYWTHQEQDLIQEVAERTRDASARAAAQQALRESEDRLARIVEHLPYGVAVLDAGGNFIASNPVMRQYAPAGLPSTHHAEASKWRSVNRDGIVLPVEQWPGLRALRGETVHYVEFEFTSEALHDWVMVSAVPLAETGNSAARVLLVMESIAARKRYEQEIIAASELKDEFLSLVSHELRTPLTIIRGNAHLLAYRQIPDDVRAEVVTDLVDSTERLTRIVENMLVLGRLAVGQMPTVEPIHFDRLLASQVERFRQRHRREVTVECGAEAVIALGVEEYAEQILDNLLSNAHKYSPAHVPITVSVSCEESRVFVNVQDRGKGVQNPDALFAPFFREASDAGAPAGLGIGLTVCKRLVEAQGGTISVHARPGGGTTFTFSLPLAPG